MRIEDTDRERSEEKFEKDIVDSLTWLGIEWSEGPLRQSERTALYTTHLERLMQEEKAFFCFHSADELKAEREERMQNKQPPLHVCAFRDLSLTEAEEKKSAGADFIIRFKTPAGKPLVFSDMVRGEVRFDSDLLGDFSIAKDTDVPLFLFANVVDDADMKISHVIRGEDHLSNVPKQMLLQEALGFARPTYAHLPLILGTDRSKLSKRDGATSINEFRVEGYLPETLFNFIALLGWNPGDDREMFTKEELVQEFSFERVQKSGAVFDHKKLDWMNGEYIRKKSVEELTELCMPYLSSAGHLEPARPVSPELVEGLIEVGGSHPLGYLQKIIALEQSRLKKLSEIAERVDYFFKEPEYEKGLLQWKKMSDEEIAVSLKKSAELVEGIAGELAKEAVEKTFLDHIGAGDKGALLWPLRVALSGKKKSPGPFEIMEILGKDQTLARIERALALSCLLRGPAS